MADATQCHDETLCHSVGEMRAEKVKAIRDIIKQYNIVDHEEKKEGRASRKKHSRKKGEISLLDIPEYWYRATLPPKASEIPIITSSPVVMMRLTSDRAALKDESMYLKLTLVEADNPHLDPPWKTNRKSIELRGGRAYVGCQCVKFNGIQDQCPRSECRGNPECLTKPYPHCAPSAHYAGPRLYLKPTTEGSQTEPPCCKCKLDGNNNAEYRAEGCDCKCHTVPLMK